MANSFPLPSTKQARIIWLALTAFCLLLFLGSVGVFIWGLGWVVQRLSTVLLPLAIAGIMAYLLDPVVDYLERKRLPRAWAILLVFFLGLAFIAGAMATIIPGLFGEIRDLSEQIPTYSKRI